MSDEHHGATLLLLQTNNEVENRMSVFAVEITGRFIREEQRWPISETARDGDALSLATGKFGWKMIEAMFEANQLQQFEGALASLRSRAIDFEHRDLHVLGRGESRQEVKRLENKPDLASTVGCRIGMIRQRYSAIEKGSGCRSIQRTE